MSLLVGINVLASVQKCPNTDFAPAVDTIDPAWSGSRNWTRHLNFRLFTPDVSLLADERRYPMVVSLHGSGAVFDAPNAQSTTATLRMNGLTYLWEHRMLEPTFILAPQLMHGVWSDDGPAQALQELVLAQVRGSLVDRRRIYMTGFSLGGVEVFDLARRLPLGLVAAASVVAAADASCCTPLPMPLLLVSSEADTCLSTQQFVRPLAQLYWDQDVPREDLQLKVIPAEEGVQHNQTALWIRSQWATEYMSFHYERRSPASSAAVLAPHMEEASQASAVPGDGALLPPGARDRTYVPNRAFRAITSLFAP